MSTWKSFTHTLAHPVHLEGGSKIVGAITLREPDVNALEAIDSLGIKEGTRPSIKQVRGILGAIADADQEVIGRLHRDDFNALNEAVAPLLLGEAASAAALSPGSSNGAAGTATS